MDIILQHKIWEETSTCNNQGNLLQIEAGLVRDRVGRKRNCIGRNNVLSWGMMCVYVFVLQVMLESLLQESELCLTRLTLSVHWEGKLNCDADSEYFVSAILKCFQSLQVADCNVDIL